MLRLRKPPTGLPKVKAGEPWSADDLAELYELLAAEVPTKDIAAFLCRTADEIEAKAAALDR